MSTFRRPPAHRVLGTAMILAAGGVLAAGCARRLTPAGPVISPTGIEYELGTPPTDTRFSQTAVLYLRQENVERALELSLDGIEADPLNPIHYYLAGTAYARLGETAGADAMFIEAERIYPGSLTRAADDGTWARAKGMYYIYLPLSMGRFPS